MRAGVSTAVAVIAIVVIVIVGVVAYGYFGSSMASPPAVTSSPTHQTMTISPSSTLVQIITSTTPTVPSVVTVRGLVVMSSSCPDGVSFIDSNGKYYTVSTGGFYCSNGQYEAGYSIQVPNYMHYTVQIDGDTMLCTAGSVFIQAGAGSGPLSYNWQC